LAKKKKRKPIRIQEAFRTVTSRGNRVVQREYEIRQNGEHIGLLNYASDLQRGGGTGLNDEFKDHFKKTDAGINFIKTARGHRNKGIGTKLLKKAERVAKKEKKNRILLEVSPDKKKNISFYKKHGYTPIDTTKRKEKWILMEKRL